MRRKRINCGRPRIFRSGEMLSVMARNRSVQSPVACCRNWVGFAPQPSWNPSQTSKPSGPRQARNTATLVHLLVRMEFMVWIRPEIRISEILLQVHTVVEAGHLIAVAIEHLGRRILKEPGQADLFGLAPAGMIHLRIHIGIEAVFMGIRDVPGRSE